MAVLLILPEFEIGPRDFGRFLVSLSLNLPGQTVTVAANTSWAPRHNLKLGHDVEYLDVRRIAGNFQHLVFVVNDNGTDLPGDVA